MTAPCKRRPRVRVTEGVYLPSQLGNIVASGAAVTSGLSGVPDGVAFIISAIAPASILFATSHGQVVVNVDVGNTSIEFTEPVTQPPLITSTGASTVWLDDFREI